MIQVRFHGRGGQGAKIASRVLGRSGFLSGLQVQDFALFGAERRKRLGKSFRLDIDAIIDIECDIWIPAARPDVVRKDNVARLKTKLVAQGANIPFTPDAEKILHDRGTLILPDFIANAGGVICASVEYHGGTQAQALDTIEEKIRRNTEEVLASAKKTNSLPRQAAVVLAEARVRKAMMYQK